MLPFLNSEFQRSTQSRISPVVPLPAGSALGRASGSQKKLRLIALAERKGEGTRWTCPPWQPSNTEGEVGGVENLLRKQAGGTVSVTDGWDIDIL